MEQLIEAHIAYEKYLEQTNEGLSSLLYLKNNIIPDPEAVDRGEELRKAIRELSGKD